MVDKQELDKLLDEVISKINAKTVLCDDFNKLIKIRMILAETTPEAVRDRLRRRTIKNPTHSHIDTPTGHQQLKLPKIADRVQPKRMPQNQQNHGRSELAHKKSTRTQRRKSPRLFDHVLKFIENNYKKPVTEDVLNSVEDKDNLRLLISKLLTNPQFDRDWLYNLWKQL